jgi:N-acetylglucosamine malate deacetylase 2
MTRTPEYELCRRLCAGAEGGRGVPSVVLVAAHPDDEVIGAGARLPCWPGVLLVHATDGAPRDLCDARARGFETREAYAAARRGELLAVLAEAGLDAGQARALGFVDQEASLCLEALSCAVADVLRERRPEVVVTHPYEGGHPDHDATALAVHAACGLLRGEGAAPPAILEMTSYHRRPSGAPRAGCPDDMETGEFLPARASRPAGEEILLFLSREERRRKRALLDCYRSQEEVLRAFPLDAERFRPAPRYDFSRPPHEGELFYERRAWGMTGARWRSLASAALGALRLGGGL